MNAALVSTVEFVVSAGGALPRDSHLAVLLRAWKAQHWSAGSVANTSL